MPDHEEMLLRTVQALEMHNLMEILPIDVSAWYQQLRLDESLLQTPAEQFCEAQVERWKQKAS